MLTALGLGRTVTGPLLVSRLLAEPKHAVILTWNPAAVPPDWQSVRQRYFRWNWVRAVFTWAAFGLFLAAVHLQAS